MPSATFSSNDHEKQWAYKADWKKIGEYSAASQPEELSFRQRMALFLPMVLDAFVAMFQVIPIIFRAIIELIMPVEPKTITGEVALVTGGGNGLGRAMAQQLADNGAKVAICDLDLKAAKETVKLLRQANGPDYQAKAYACDVTDPDALKALSKEIEQDFGESVSILVINAGLMPSISITNGADDDYRKVVDINLLSSFWAIRAFLPGMRKRNHGHIVLISSASALNGPRGLGVYSATKYALRGLAESLESELQYQGLDINVSCVYPYFIATRRFMAENIDIRIPPLSVKVAAFQIIDGMRRNYKSFAVPGHLLYLMTFLKLLPNDAVILILEKVAPMSINPQVIED